MSSQSRKTVKRYNKDSKSSKQFKVGLGVVTYNRPDYLAKVLSGIIANLRKEVDAVWIYDDCSSKGIDEYSQIADELPTWIKYHRGNKNKGVGGAKNWLMRKLLDEGCYCLFIGEDDIIPTSKMAIRGYVKASRETGISHFMYAHHGPVNKGGANYRLGVVETYPGCVGGWCFFTKPAIEEVGLHDEAMRNAYEHVFLTWKLARARRTTPWGYFADVKGSKKWLQEIPESITNSSIKKTPRWAANAIKALTRWKSIYPDEFPLQHVLDNTVKELESSRDKLAATK